MRTSDTPDDINDDARRMEAVAMNQPPFAQGLGVRITSIELDCVEAEMEVVEALGNRNGVLHGGAIMGFADNVGGTATSINLAKGQSTTTLESKTNFLRAIPIGDVARARCVPIHRGRRTMVWQTTITRRDGKVAAVITQTQMVLDAAE